MARLSDKASKVLSAFEEHSNSTSVVNLLSSDELLQNDGILPIPIGIDMHGDAVVFDITTFPHLLIGGTTGSGKTEFIRSLLSGMMALYSTDVLKVIISDPKRVDYQVFNDTPHLLLPIATNPEKVLEAIQWTSFESQKRLSLFAERNCKDIEEFNNKNDAIPYVIAVLDNFADISNSYGAEKVEEMLLPVLRLGRTVGIHYIISTSTPTTKVITTSLKANIPSRMSFRVPSSNISRMILDSNGAETLVEQGEFIIKTGAQQIKGNCLHAKEEEVSVAIEEIKRLYNSSFKGMEAKYLSLLEKAARLDISSNNITDIEQHNNVYDELLPQAVDVFLEVGQASVSLLQRRLRLGYARAARLVDKMEEMGIIGQYEDSKPRALLITKTQWQQMKYATGATPVDTIVDMESNDSTNGSSRIKSFKEVLQDVDRNHEEWRLFLFSALLDNGIKYKIASSMSSSSTADIRLTPRELVNWSIEKNNKYHEIYNFSKKLFEVDFFKAMNPKDETCDNTKDIVRIAKAYVDVYGDYYDFLHEIDRLHVDNIWQLQKLVNIQRNFFKSAVNAFDKHNNDLKNIIKRIVSGEKIDSIKMEITLSFNSSEYYTALERAKKIYSY